jgi:hypothetical protein
MSRLIPIPLFQQADMSSNDITKWLCPQWEKLFSNLEKEFCTPTEQWNSECRKELRMKLVAAQNDFYKKWKPLSEGLIKKSMDEINLHGNLKKTQQLRAQVLQLRWNFEEYKISYNILLEKLPVAEYYITELFDEGSQPALKVKISKPKKFWDELVVRLIATDNYTDKIKILQTMN